MGTETKEPPIPNRRATFSNVKNLYSLNDIQGVQEQLLVWNVIRGPQVRRRDFFHLGVHYQAHCPLPVRCLIAALHPLIPVTCLQYLRNSHETFFIHPICSVAFLTWTSFPLKLQHSIPLYLLIVLFFSYIYFFLMPENCLGVMQHLGWGLLRRLYSWPEWDLSSAPCPPKSIEV